MICKVINYNKYSHVLVVDYAGIRVQFVTNQYKGDKQVNVVNDGNRYRISSGTATKYTRTNRRSELVKENTVVNEEHNVTENCTNGTEVD